MTLKKRLLAIDLECAAAHQTLNRIAMDKVDLKSKKGQVEIGRAVRAITAARDALHDLAAADEKN